MKVLTIIAMAIAVGCTQDAVDVSGCIKSALASEVYWEEMSLRWLTEPSVYRTAMDTPKLDAMAHNFVTNISMRFKCAVPLFIKFSKDRSLKEDRSADHLVDVRNNVDYPYCLEMILVGNAEALLSNRLYFCRKADNGEHIVVCARRIDNIHAWYSPSPSLEKRLVDDIGMFDVRRRGLCPVFLGDDEYDIEQFLRKFVDGGTALYWWCGQRGPVCEGKHIYDACAFEKWVERNKDFLVPMRIVFSVGDTFIFSIDSSERPGA